MPGILLGILTRKAVMSEGGETLPYRQSVRRITSLDQIRRVHRRGSRQSP